jgi:arylsulfatase A-like enzyme
MRLRYYLALLTFLALAQTAFPVQKPNIIFILADDLGYGDVGCFGQKLIKTPSIDSLAREGTRFTQFYAGSTVCAPSRCALMTGRHMGRARVRGNGHGVLQPEDVTVAEVLKEAGYTAGLVGKWGLGNEGTVGEASKQGFDFSFGYLDQTHAHDYWTDHLFRNGQRVEIPPKTYSHDLMEKEALDFIRREKAKPFFLYAAFTLPHGNFQPPDNEPYAREAWKTTHKNVAAMITRLDSTVGKMMRLLKELNLDQNTIVFFTSDNGPRSEGNDFFNSNGGLRGIKRDLYEGGIREPMIVRWPGQVKPGATSDQVWAFWDFLPTAAEIAGAKAPKNIDGVSLLPALLGKQKVDHAPLYWEFYERGFEQALRVGDWKAVRHAPGQPIELYDLSKDISEKKDVASVNPAVVERMEAAFKSERTEYEERPEMERKTKIGATAEVSKKAKKKK